MTYLCTSDFDNYYAHVGDESSKITDRMMLFHTVQQRRQLALQIMLFLCILYIFFQCHCNFVVPIVVFNAILMVIFVVFCSSSSSS